MPLLQKSDTWADLVEYENGIPSHNGQRTPRRNKLNKFKAEKKSTEGNNTSNKQLESEFTSVETKSAPAWRKRLIGIALLTALAGGGATGAYFGITSTSTQAPYCNVTAWSNWTECTVTCGGGVTERNRSTVIADSCVTNETVVLEDSDVCNSQHCPIDGAWTTWTSWDACPITCECCGTQHRTRTCTNPSPQYGGAKCAGSASSTQSCSVETKCPVNGAWTTWASWNTCPITCECCGTQLRSRTCTNPAPQYGGTACTGAGNSSKTCQVATKCPIDGSWTSWSSWGSCSVTCESGTQLRSRTCSNPTPQYGGADCIEDDSETRTCTVDTMCPIDGAWSSWSSWGSCPVTCESGTQSRSRTCTNPTPEYGGAACSGDATSKQPCTVATMCPIDGAWSTWSSWSSCSVTCESGSQSRSRACTNPAPKYGGASCSGSEIATQSCTVSTMCPINGGWSAWSSWGSCSVTCGSGSQSSSRTCSNPTPQYNGATCSGASTQTQTCATGVACAINGNWAAWGAWSSCSLTCNGQCTQTATRSCTNPAPQNGGSACSGSSSQTQLYTLSTTPCPVNGNWEAWGAWSSCSLTCNGQCTQTQTRSCSNPAPAYGGAACAGSSSQTQIYLLQTNPCPNSCTALCCGASNNNQGNLCKNYVFGCWCDPMCETAGDCCKDYWTLCK